MARNGWWAAPCLGLLCQACFVPREAGERMQQDLTALRGEVVRLNARIATDEAERREWRAQEGNDRALIEARLEALRQSSTRADADFGQQLAAMLGDVQRLHGAIEENEHRLTETEARLQQELQSRLAALRQATARDEKEAPSPLVKQAAPRGKKELLRYGLELLAKGNKADGRGVLRDVVRKYGKEKGLADEALFALGLSAAKDGQAEAALRDLVRLIDRFPGHARQAQSYYQIGACSEALGRTEDAATFYAEVTTNFATSPEAKLARKRLAALAAARAKGDAAVPPSSRAPAPATAPTPAPPPKDGNRPARP